MRYLINVYSEISIYKRENEPYLVTVNAYLSPFLNYDFEEQTILETYPKYQLGIM